MATGFLTDTTVCIGCKACEVACKQWNDLPSDGGELLPGSSYDNTRELSASTWRHVRFVELLEPAGGHMHSLPAGGSSLPASPELPSGHDDVDLLEWAENGGGDRWVFMSDVCKHCTHAGCLDACPTGAIFRSEFGTVVVQADVCNGCGYCIPSCPFGVIDRDHEDGRAAKCTLCYDRLQDGLEPACAKACPTDSIQFGEYNQLVERARGRVTALHQRGIETAYLYGAGDTQGEELAGGLGAFFLLTEPPERYGLPAQADSPIDDGVVSATLSAMAAGIVAALGVAAAFAWPKQPSRAKRLASRVRGRAAVTTRRPL